MAWRESNDLVARIGGWQAYAREGQGGAEAGSDAGKAAMPAGHGGMDMRAPPGTGTPAALSPAASSPGKSAAPVETAPATQPPAEQFNDIEST